MDKGQKSSSSNKEMKKRKDDGLEPGDSSKRRVCRFPLLVALLQLLLGVAVTVVAFLMLAISPSLLARETPHWAGIIVSSIFSKLLHQPTRLFAWSLVVLHDPLLHTGTCCPSPPHCMPRLAHPSHTVSGGTGNQWCHALVNLSVSEACT